MKSLPPVRRGLASAFALALTAALLPSASADTLKLKNGTTLEGRVLSQTPESVKFEWRPSPSIKEEKDFPKTEIAELKIQAPDDVAIIEIRKLLPTKEMMSPTEYSKAIDSMIKPFLTKFPTSKHAEEVKKLLATYEEELGKVNGGWQKLDDRWISPDEYRWNYYVIDARVVFKEMQKELKANNLKGALDKIAKLKKDFVATKSYVEALDVYAKLLDDYDRELLRMSQEQPSLLKDLNERKKTLDKSALNDLEFALKKEAADLKVKVQGEIAAKIPIISVDKLDANSLKAGAAAVAKERVVVQKLLNDKPKFSETAELVEQALAESGKGNPQMALTLIDQAMKKFGGNDAVLKGFREKWKIAADEMAKLAPKPTAVSTEIPAKTDTAPAPKTSDKTDKNSTKTDKSTTPKPSTAPAPLEEEDDSSSMLFLVAAGVLILGALGWMFAKKKKVTQDDEE